MSYRETITFPDNAILKAATGNLSVIVNGVEQQINSGGGGGDSGAITSADGITTLQPIGSDTTLYLGGPGDGGTWLFSADGPASAPVGVGSGNATETTSGTTYVYTGNATGTANSGDLEIGSGNSAGANSGHIRLLTGTADGTRGPIILDAPEISAPSGFQVDSGPSAISLTVNEQSADNGNGADVVITAGPGGGISGNGGKVTLLSGNASHGNTGDFYAASNTVSAGSGNSGSAGVESGGAPSGNTGGVFLGTSDAGGKSGSVSVYTGASHGANQDAGDIVIATGGPTNGNARGGDISLTPNNGVGSGRRGLVLLANLPTADPHVLNAAWIDVAAGRVVKVSAG